MASREVMEEGGFFPLSPDLHSDPAMLASLALAVQDATGLENLALPFRMTVESEAYGGETEESLVSGAGRTEPCYPLESVKDFSALKTLDPERDGRLPKTLSAVGILSKGRTELPVIGDLVGPLGLATSLVDTKTLLKSLLREPAEAHAFLSFLAEGTARYGRALVGAGADVVSITDPASTAEILGPEFFKEFAVPYLNRITAAMHTEGVPVMVHLCGDIRGLRDAPRGLRAECVSVDPRVSIADARLLLPRHRIMGNLDPELLASGTTGEVREAVTGILDQGPDIVAPGCAVGPGAAAEKLGAMVSAVSMS